METKYKVGQTVKLINVTHGTPSVIENITHFGDKTEYRIGGHVRRDRELEVVE